VVSLHDTLELFVDVSDSHATDPDMFLVDRAIELVNEFVGQRLPIGYRLEKRIPVAAGLGGGSSDAAAALLAACRLHGVRPSVSELGDMALALGSDVPFFLSEGAALVEGRGEEVTTLQPRVGQWILLVNDGVPVSTGAVFKAVQPADLEPDCQVDLVRSRLESGVVVVGGNHLEPAAARVHCGIQVLLAQLRDMPDVRGVAMSGSGGTCFAVFDDRRTATNAKAAMDGLFPWVRVATTERLSAVRVRLGG
jgi:4-diphosphocytidyl-2-C-methyl-D-erythritol kinase